MEKDSLNPFVLRECFLIIQRHFMISGDTLNVPCFTLDFFFNIYFVLFAFLRRQGTVALLKKHIVRGESEILF